MTKTVYPRVCGGTPAWYAAMPPAGGLSPRVRGNPSIISAWGVIETVYPRVCGGTWIARQALATYPGLSPRVRGNRAPCPRHRGKVRSIPACAGEPALLSPPAFCGWVYPRVCGGTIAIPIPAVKRQGLSPRVRGNPNILSAAAPLIGSIPACAGEPVAVPAPGRHTRVYPRVCGGTLPAPTAGG